MEPVIVLLAAGRSTRMRGRDKLLEPVGLQPLLRKQARRAAQAAPTRVVLGPGQTERQAALEDVNVTLLEAPEGAGMAASISVGVQCLTGPTLIALADMPEITALDFHLMLSLHAQAPETILRAASKGGQPGHPVLFPADLITDLAKLQGDQGAREILKREASRVRLLPLEDDRALVDLDTPEDWETWRKHHG